MRVSENKDTRVADTLSDELTLMVYIIGKYFKMISKKILTSSQSNLT